LRQKIDEGLGQCTHFIVLLTKESVSKAWVNQEIDAGLVRKLTDGSAFIPLRCGLSTKDLPPLLSGLLSPSIDESTLDLQQLIADVHGITRKPPRSPQLPKQPSLRPAIQRPRARSPGTSSINLRTAYFTIPNVQFRI
jgi:TIR domain